MADGKLKLHNFEKSELEEVSFVAVAIRSSPIKTIFEWTYCSQDVHNGEISFTWHIGQTGLKLHQAFTQIVMNGSKYAASILDSKSFLSC